MYSRIYQQLLERSMTPNSQESSIAFLAEHLGKFLKKKEVVLICFLSHEQGNLGWLMEQAVLRCDAVPVVWGPDRRWKTLLRLAFSSKASTIIGAPLLLLGLVKLKKANGIPLYVRKVITAGYPCMGWMVEGITKGFDCQMGGCYSIGITGIVAGFACGHSWGVHVREAEYGIDIVDENGASVPAEQMGEIVIYPRKQPELRYPTGEWGRLVTTPCKCGSDTIRLMDMRPGKNEDPDLVKLGQYLQSWTSILDCRMNRSEYGLEMEIVTFPGEKLPKLPSAAKQIIRPWNPEEDEPFWYLPELKNPGIYEESH